MSWKLVYKISHSWVDVLVFYVLLFRVVHLEVFKEERMSHRWVFEWHARFKQTEKGDRQRAKSGACSTLFFDIKGIVCKEFILAGQSQFCILL
jgi:hypothetical protein